jgi:hypothetical protein
MRMTTIKKTIKFDINSKSYSLIWRWYNKDSLLALHMWHDLPSRDSARELSNGISSGYDAEPDFYEEYLGG